MLSILRISRCNRTVVFLYFKRISFEYGLQTAAIAIIPLIAVLPIVSFYARSIA
ncbi:MAG: hypothetical protein WBA76_07420 [Phormidesmis sp.]